jgi:transcriptional regulator with XRE-family HTH domain
MPSLNNRIRQARRIARLSQSELSSYVHVARSAVAQWERRDGVTPTVRHLIDIAIATNTGLEWLATGRGPIAATYPNLIADEQTLVSDQYQAINTLEQRALAAMRALPVREAQAVVEMMEVIAAQRQLGKAKRSIEKNQPVDFA